MRSRTSGGTDDLTPIVVIVLDHLLEHLGRATDRGGAKRRARREQGTSLPLETGTWDLLLCKRNGQGYIDEATGANQRSSNRWVASVE